MYEISTLANGGRIKRIVQKHDSLHEAVEALRKLCYFVEEDLENIGCWDGAGHDGNVYSVEHANRPVCSLITVQR